MKLGRIKITQLEREKVMNVQSNRRRFIQGLGACTASVGLSNSRLLGGPQPTDSRPTQLYKSLSDEQRAKVCLPNDHPRRGFVSNWWYIHPEHRIPSTFDKDQQELIQDIFDSLHSAEHQDAVNEQVLFDQYGTLKNAPAVGFFGSPEDEDFEFIYTGHHVTRRCNAHSDTGQGFGGNPIFYGHFRESFNESPDHPGNPYWYQGKIFNEFAASLSEDQKLEGLAGIRPRSESPQAVIKKRPSNWPGLRCSDLNNEQQEIFLQTLKKMLGMFRQADVESTLKEIESRSLVNDLHVSWYGGKYDIGNDQVWDTWQIESPEMVWYFRGQPHIHCYFHLKNAS